MLNGSQEELSVYHRQRLDRLLTNYKLTPMTLAMKLNPKIIPAAHLNYISAKVATTIAKGNGRLIISTAPRHGKSELITKNTPIWTLENYGQKNVILCTYGGELSTDFGRKVRDLVKDNEHLLNIRIRQDASRVNNWLTNLGGAMMSVGLGGPITGRGADVLLIDDYIKEIKESLSPAHREYIWNWFITTAFTRLEPGGSCIIIATRWHEDDLIGRILKHNPGGRWENIVIPALAEPEGYDPEDPSTHDVTDILGRKYGDALFPERYNKEELLEKKSTLGAYFFNALYQQRPEDENAKLTDKSWIKYIYSLDQITPEVQKRLKWARIWDLAATEGGGDYTAGTLMAYDKVTDNVYIINVNRFQKSPQGVETEVRRTALLDGEGVTIYIEREPGSSGKALVEHYEKTVLRGFKVEGVSHNDKKLARAQPWLANVEAGKTFVLSAPWNQAFVDEYDEFPAGEHDDQVDTCSIGYTKLSGKTHLRSSWGRDNKSGTEIPDDWTRNPNFSRPAAKHYGDQSQSDESAKPLEGQIILPTRRNRVTFGRNISNY